MLQQPNIQAVVIFLPASMHAYYLGHSHIETRNGSDQVTQQHVWDSLAPGSGHYIDSLAQVGNNTNPSVDNTIDQKLYAMQDQQFNVMALADDTGAVVERYEYTLYGQRTVMNASYAVIHQSAYNLQVGYTGQRHDPESGLWYFRARMYDPKLGRFIQRDPIGYPDGMNTYCPYYALSHASDPLGMSHLYGRDQLPTFMTYAVVKQPYGNNCWTNCRSAEAGCLRNGGKKNACDTVRRNCFAYCSRVSAARGAISAQGLRNAGIDRATYESAVTAGGVVAEAVEGTADAIRLNIRSTGGLVLGKTGMIVRGVGGAAGALGQISQAHQAAQTIQQANTVIDDIGLTKAFRTTWDSHMDQIIPDFEQDFDPLRGLCDIRGNAFLGMFRAGWLIETNAQSGNDAENTYGFYLTSCYNGKTYLYHTSGNGWRKSELRNWHPSKQNLVQQSDWGKNCFMPDEMLALDMMLVGP